jgi:hypothetical protein
MSLNAPQGKSYLSLHHSKSRNFEIFYFWSEKIRDERKICRDKRGIETFQKTVMDEIRDKRNHDKRGLPVSIIK